MSTARHFDPLEPLQHEEIARLFSSVGQWSTARWQTALTTAADSQHRAKRATARLLCDAILATERRALSDWMLRDLARTAVDVLAPAIDRWRAIELLEDAALALLARPGLALADLAVLLQPCLPFGESIL